MTGNVDLLGHCFLCSRLRVVIIGAILGIIVASLLISAST